MSGPFGLQQIRIRDSIHAKSMIFIGVIMASLVGFLTVYFASQAVRNLREDQHARVCAYADLVGAQARSAVAFSDHETAREVLSGLRSDPDVVATVLFGADGAALDTFGSPSSWVETARQGVLQKQIVWFRDRVAVVTPVTSLEGPRGTLVVELSRARMLSRQRSVVTTAIALGIAALLTGALFGSMMARRFANRLRAIATVASDVSRGATAHREVDVTGRDEIGLLATVFNDMLAKLHGNQQQLENTIEELRRAEDDLACTNRELESRVEARTAELRAANGQLVIEMEHRGRIEAELRQAQKLESVGRLAAGVAHEINTPMQYVGDSIEFAREVVSPLIAVAELQQRMQAAPSSELDALVRESRELFDPDDLEIVREELPLAFERALDGVNRVKTIVRSMRVFSHHDDKMVATDLNAAITNVLTVARNEYRYVADVETDFGRVPLVRCLRSEIDQVVLNIVMNAVHAIHPIVESTGQRGTITVRTREDADAVLISIADTGPGIPHDIRERVFEPFFTTKPVGKGTGQGLAIAHAIVVQKHQGTIAFESEVGRGTTFHIRLPVRRAVPSRIDVAPPPRDLARASSMAIVVRPEAA